MNRSMLLEWKPELLIVLAPDSDSIVCTDYVDVLRGRGKLYGICESAQTILHLLIRPAPRENGFLFHRVAQPVVSEGVFSEEDAKVNDAAEED